MKYPSSRDKNIPNALSGDHRFQLLVNAIKDYAIYLLDADGYVNSWNTGAQRFKGYTADEIIGQHFSCFYTEEDRADGLPARALRTAAEMGSFESEGWRVRKDGSRFWTNVVIDPVYGTAGELLGFAKITRDIGDKRAAQQKLYASEQRFRMLVQGVRDYAIYMLEPDGRVANWNTGAQTIKGYTADEIVGQHFSRFYTEEDRKQGEPQRALALALRDGKFENEAWRVRKDGSYFWANVVIDPIYDETGTFVGFAKITRDITERRLAREEIDRGRNALNQAQKMEAIGRLTGGVAHDFNNLLTVILSSAELLRRSDLTDDKRERYVKLIAETAQRATLLTKQLLAFARKQPLQPEMFSAAARIEGLEQVIASTVGSPVGIEFDFSADGGLIEADPNQFETAVLNMAINARDAMPNGGTLRISTRNVDRVPAVRGHAGAEGNFVAVSLRDNGTGIEAETLRRIFEPFFTTKAINAGTGLGLSQVYGFAKQSGGEIDVVTELGEGSTFTLYLPRAEVQARVPAPCAASLAPVERIQKTRVLLVEDNETVGLFASELLAELGLEVTRAAHGQEALAILATQSGNFDVVFSDVVMPGIDGIELGTEIRARWPRLRVVLTSGYSHVLAERGTHGFEFVEKPYSTLDLIKILGHDEHGHSQPQEP